MSRGKKIALWTVVAVVFAVGIAGGLAIRSLRHLVSDLPGHEVSIGTAIGDIRQIATDPRSGFVAPDGQEQDKINILCMGIDDNWTNSDVVYTRGARTDTLFLLTLDLNNKRASILSIPRDTYTHIAGTDYSDKINSAFSTGGPMRSIATVAEMTGVHADHYLVLNIDATKKMVDALGGVDLDVEHPMRYDDNWGHLHVDLKPGFQHLDGNEAVGFARYRHPDAGQPPTPEDGDERRMYRQHVLLRAMVAKAKDFTNFTQMNHLVDIGMSTIRTDLTRTQLLDLASLYQGIQQDDPNAIRTASLPGTDFIGPHGAWDYKLDPEAMKAYVAWFVNDDPTLIDHMTAIIVQNGTAVPGLAKQVVDKLQSEGYTHVVNGGNAPRSNIQLTDSTGSSGLARTVIVDTGVPDKNVPQTLAQDLGVSAVVGRHPVKPNRVGWTPPPVVTIALGQDYAIVAKDGAPPITSGGTASN